MTLEPSSGKPVGRPGRGVFSRARYRQLGSSQREQPKSRHSMLRTHEICARCDSSHWRRLEVEYGGLVCPAGQTFHVASSCWNVTGVRRPSSTASRGRLLLEPEDVEHQKPGSSQHEAPKSRHLTPRTHEICAPRPTPRPGAPWLRPRLRRPLLHLELVRQDVPDAPLYVVKV